MTKKPKRHIRRAPYGKQVTRMTYCGRGITPRLSWCDPGDEEPTDCHWCRITLAAERRGVRQDADEEPLENLEAGGALYDRQGEP
jgi:hypothetical protein